MEVDLDADIEIDPDLFIKCRLCIEENGAFRIHQSLQDQIKFCFDITVQDFDYLSKLLCKKCRTILGEFVTIKKKFIANQTLLLDKLQSKEKQRACNDTNTECNIEKENKKKAEKEKSKEKQQECNDTNTDCHIEKEYKKKAEKEKASIDQITQEETKTKKNKKKRVKKRASLFTSSSSEDEENSSHSQSVSHTCKRRKRKISSSTEPSCERELKPAVLEKETIKIDEPKQTFTWEQSYQKFYVCRFCDYKNHTEDGIIMHGKIHSKLMESYREPLKKHCIIQMEKMDERPNVTGDPGNVVLSHDKIVSDVHNACYYVKYLLPEQCYEGNRISALKRIVYDSSEDDAVRKYCNRKNKKIRMQSRSSSNETVVLEGSKIKTSDKDSNSKDTLKKTKNISDSLDIPCIDIVDTSSNDSNEQLKHNHTTKDNELKTIHDVTTDCLKKYLASCANVPQNESSNKNLDEMLHRKLLSVGRKLMPTNVPRGLPTPGLLKYLQYKNVNINWIPATACKQNFCRIITEIAPQNTNTNLKGWYAIKGNVDFEVRDEIPDDHQHEQIPNENENDSDKTVENNDQEIPIFEQEIKTSTTSMNTTSDSSTPVVNVAKTFMGPAVLHQIMDADIEQGNKLLNANPVANPKQLPKKSTFMPLYELKKPVDSNNTPKTTESVKDSLLLVGQNQQPELPMPIITSTTSLAEKPMKQNGIAVSNQPETPSNQRNETVKNTPRIKCKPVSELMPQSRAVVGTPPPVQKAASINHVPNLVSIISKTPPKPAQQALFTSTPDRGKITMNSVDLPNSSSISPIEYFKTVLKMHGLELISQKNYKLTHDFISLVKFKLECSLLERTVIICLSLFAHESTFCLKLRTSAEDMDLDQLSAHWQMKILEAYRGEVSQKILQFSKTLNERLHKNAKQFVLLLENIEFKITPGLGE